VPDIAGVMQGALADRNADVRRAALEVLPGLALSDADKVGQLASVLTNGSTEDKQAAFGVLGKLKSPAAAQLLASYLEKVPAGEVPPGIQLDLVDAAQANGAPSLKAKLDAHRLAKSAPTLAAAFRDAMLSGGSAPRGRLTFAQNPAAGCPRCHTVGTEGSDVGPNLTHIGTTLSRDLLLQALLEPNARIAPGFGTASVTLRSGERLDGTLRSETETEVVLLGGTPATERRIPKANIASQTNPVSPMPPFGEILSLREIRDLVEFLSTLK
jgi:putative heme-binding domain-containing protein